jgi:hypothetical protein
MGEVSSWVTVQSALHFNRKVCVKRGIVQVHQQMSQSDPGISCPESTPREDSRAMSHSKGGLPQSSGFHHFLQSVQSAVKATLISVHSKYKSIPSPFTYQHLQLWSSSQGRLIGALTQHPWSGRDNGKVGGALDGSSDG